MARPPFGKKKGKAKPRRSEESGEKRPSRDDRGGRETDPMAGMSGGMPAGAAPPEALAAALGPMKRGGY